MNQKLYIFFQNSNLCYVEYDLNKNMFIAVNDVFADTIGYTKEELLSLNISDLIIESDIDLTHDFIRYGTGNPKTRVINRYRNKITGEIITFMWFNEGVAKAQSENEGTISTFAMNISEVINNIEVQKKENELLIDFIEYLRL